MRRLAFLAAASLGLGVAVIVDQPASFAHHLVLRQSEIRPGGNLSHTNLSGSHELNYANLTGANLRDANLSKANLSSTKLRGADLSDANLRGANLRDAKLSGANLSRADLSGANLRGANLRDAKLRGVTATDLRGCPVFLPSGWRCFDYSLIQF